eukprot:jgi/Psemu1/31051/gm1.31051_g
MASADEHVHSLLSTKKNEGLKQAQRAGEGSGTPVADGGTLINKTRKFRIDWPSPTGEKSLYNSNTGATKKGKHSENSQNPPIAATRIPLLKATTSKPHYRLGLNPTGRFEKNSHSHSDTP